MFNSNDFTRESINKIEIAIAKIDSNLASLSHKVGNINQSTNNLTDLLYSGKESVINQLSILQNKSDKLELIVQKINELDDRATKLEKALDIMKVKANSNTKFIVVVASVTFAYIIPNIFDKVIPPQKVYLENKFVK